MGLAVPSVAEASRGLPSVKAVAPAVDDEIVTSVAFSRAASPEQVSPELALVDPDLAERLRALLPDPPDALAPRPAQATRPSPSTTLAVHAAAPVVARATIDVAVPVAAHTPGPANVRQLRPRALVETADPGPAVSRSEAIDPHNSLPRLEVESQPLVADPSAGASPASRYAETAGRWLAQGAERTAAAAAPLLASLRESAATHRRMLGAFAAGAVVASFVVVGVIAALGESSAAPVAVADGAPPSLVPPAIVAPSPPPAATPKPAAGATKSSSTASEKPVTAGKKTSTGAAKKNAAASATATKKSAATAKSKANAARASGAPKPAAAAPARRFAWAPVEGAVGYRVELFRGDEQVLRATTKQPVYELPGSWRHQGRAERLTPGSYRWYVWPVRAAGPAAEAVVQARLDVP